MATLIPALCACVSRMSAGEKRLAELLEKMLDNNYQLWYDEPVSGLQSKADFVVLHPRRGLLVLEVKDWRLSSLLSADKLAWNISPDGSSQGTISPLESARQYVVKLVRALEREPQLVHANGVHQGKLAFSWCYGLVLANITRRQLDAAELYHWIEPNRVICQDELLETVSPLDLQSRLWAMFPYSMRGNMTQTQLERVSSFMTPEVHLPCDILGMDPQQVQLTLNLGDGHCVMHSMAGSSNTLPKNCPRPAPSSFGHGDEAMSIC